MNNLNSVLLEGNLVRDPQSKTTTNGAMVTKITLACNRYYQSEGEDGWIQEVSYFDIEAWGRLAEKINSLGKKGRGARIVGRLKQDRWTDDNGNNRSKIYVVAEHAEFRPEKPNEAQNNDEPTEQTVEETV